MHAIGTTFEGGTIDITGDSFESCTFKQCAIIAEGGGWTITGQTQFLGPIQIYFGSNDTARHQFAAYVKAGAGGDVQIIDHRPPAA